MTAPSAVLFYKKPKPDRRKCHMRGVSDNTDLWHPTLCRARVRDDIDTTPPLADDPAKVTCKNCRRLVDAPSEPC